MQSTELLHTLRSWRENNHTLIDQIIIDRYCSGAGNFIDQSVDLHRRIFGIKFVSNCPSCIIEGITRLNNKYLALEYEANQPEELEMSNQLNQPNAKAKKKRK